MRGTKLIVLAAALCTGFQAVAEKQACTSWEPGSRYPWQSNAVMRGDRYTWIFLDVDRSGRAFRCEFGENNFPDPEMLFWLCKSYMDRWRGPPAQGSDAKIRTLKRFSLIAGYDHHIADQNARKAWFKSHPEERPECYPEPTRPDRLG